MEVYSFQNIEQVPKQSWNDSSLKTALFHQHNFLKALDDAKVENARMEFLTVEHEDELIATCVLSTFVLNLDLFLGENKIVQWLKLAFPNIFKVNVLF